MKRLTALVLSLLFSLLFVTSTLYAQKTTGTITGTVTDATGAAMPNAKVTATNVGTGAVRTVQGSGQGEYTFADLEPGVYTVSVASAGFKEFKAKGVVLSVASIRTVDAKLQPGGATEVVTVEANAVQVQTQSGEVGEVVNGTQVRELPLNGRNFIALTQLQPGVSAANFFNTKDKGLQGGADFSVNGNPVTNNLFLVDGANNNDVGSNRTILIYPSVESISEFKMLRNSYGPEYGQASGAVISIVTKGGTNQFHGSFGYSGRNDALNATDYFAAQAQAAAKSTGQSLPNNGKDRLRRNDEFYSIGGPVKKDKLFFFFSEEFNKELRGQTRHACVPTAVERAGDFSQGFSGATAPSPTNTSGTVATGNCGAVQPAQWICTSLNPAACLNGTGTYAYRSTIPAANQAPGNPFKIAAPSPAGLLLTQLLPLPNLTAASGSNTNWSQSVGTLVHFREESARADWNLSSKHTFTARYTQDSWTNPAPNTQSYWGDDPFPAVEGSWDQPSKSAAGKLTSTLTNTLINEATFAYSNNRILTTPGGTNPGLTDKINAALPTVFPASQKLKGGQPTIWGGLGPYGDGQSLWLIAPFHNSMDLYTVRDDISKIRGNHTWKAGIFGSWNGKNEDQFGGQDRPSFGTGGPVSGDTLNNLANVLSPGTVFNIGENTVNPEDQGRWHDVEFYVGDTWKMRRNITLDYGFRWSFLREPYDNNDLMSSWDPRFYNPKLPSSDPCNGLVIVPGTDPCGDFNKANGTTYSHGTPGPNRALVNNNNHNIAPRLGVAWDLFGNGRTALRFGAGQFFQRERVSPQVGLSSNAPFSISTSVNRTLDNAPPPSALAVSAPNDSKDSRGVTPNSWQWNVSVEQELLKDTTLQLGYVGNRGLHLTSSVDINQVPAGAGRLQAAFGSGSVVNSFRPAPAFGTINRFSREGSSSYHSLQALFRSRVRSWAQIQASYTWSHSLDNVGLDNSSGGGSYNNFSDLSNLGLDKGNSAINRPNIFVGNAIFTLPRFADTNAFIKNGLGGWELTAIGTAENGNSVSVFAGGFNDINSGKIRPGDPNTPLISSLSGTGFTQNERPNRVTGVSCYAGNKGAQVINPAAFTLTNYKIGTVGNAPRGACLAPSYMNLDFALYKNWYTFSEKLQVQFRLEAFDVFNHANFRGDQINGVGGNTGTFISGATAACGNFQCSPTNNVITSFTAPTNTGFGQAQKTKGARELQYTLKFVF